MAINWSGRIKRSGCNDDTLYSKQVLRLTILSVYIKYHKQVYLFSVCKMNQPEKLSLSKNMLVFFSKQLDLIYDG